MSKATDLKPHSQAASAADVCIPPFTFDEYLELSRQFHSYPAPGILVGGFMVAEAQRYIPEGTLYDAISETSWCLPDAIQILTPCTIGNGWLRILDLGVYALALFDKFTGDGIRVTLDPVKLKAWPHIHTWLFKTRGKQEQDSDQLRQDIREAGASLCSVEPVTLPPTFLRRRSKGEIARCRLCGDAYPARYGAICRRCQGEGPYVNPLDVDEPQPRTKAIPVAKSIGKTVLHDMTQIIPGQSKEPAFHRGHVVTAGDVCRLQHMGRFHVHVEQECPEGYIHEDDAARAFGQAMAGPGTVPSDPPREGKVQIMSQEAGLLLVNEELQESFNLLPDVMVASRHGYTVVDKGKKLAGTRAIPLFLKKTRFDRAMTLLQDGPMFEVRPLRKARAGLLITGNEVFHGLIEDKFESIVTSKLLKLGSEVAETIITPDDSKTIARAVKILADKGCDLIITTAGLSVDPDDVTRNGLVEGGVTDMLYGMPVLPGAMTLIAKRGPVQVLGVPACALYYKTTSLDLLLPRLLAGVEIRRADLAKLGAGGLCRECAQCVYPKCPFGK